MLRLLIVGLLAMLPLQVDALTLKIATIAPDSTTWMQELRKGAEVIKQRTAGRVKLRFFPGGIMGNDKSVLRKIRIGQLHGAAVTVGGLEEIYADTQIYSIPLAFRSYEEVDYVRERMDTLIIDGLKERGFISFGLSEGGFAYLMSSHAIRTIEDLKERKVWIPEGDRIDRSVFQALGVSAIPLPLTDVLTGLQTGLIDTISATPTAAIALQWHTRVDHLTDLPLVYLYSTLIVDREALERVSPADQAIVAEVMGEVVQRLNRLSRADDAQAREALRQQGIVFVEPAAEEREKWREVVAHAVNELSDQGIYDRKMLSLLSRYLADYRQGRSDVSRR